MIRQSKLSPAAGWFLSLALPWLAASVLTGCSSSEKACSYNGGSYAVGERFPATDGCNTCSCAANGQVACTLSACQDPACVLDASYSYGETGGLVAFTNLATLTPPASYRYARMFRGADPPEHSCSPAMPSCGSTEAIDVADLTRDIAKPDVQAALALATPPLYGKDDRPVDGTVFQFLRSDGHGFLAGVPCGPPQVDCRVIPVAIQQLVDDLRALDTHQLMDPSCADVVTVR